jgi:hypothetical protein
LFRQALLSCPDVTSDDFPQLVKNKVDNPSKLTLFAYRRLMLYIGRLYQAWATLRILRGPGDRFDFETYPKLGKMCHCIERHLQEQSGQTSKSRKKRKIEIADKNIARSGVAKKPVESQSKVIDQIRSELDCFKNDIELATSSLVEKMFETVQDLEREKEDNVRVQVRSPTYSEVGEYVEFKMMEEKKKTKKRKKHKKHSK